MICSLFNTVMYVTLYQWWQSSGVNRRHTPVYSVYIWCWSPRWANKMQHFPAPTLHDRSFTHPARMQLWKSEAMNVHVTVSANQTASYEQLQYPYWQPARDDSCTTWLCMSACSRSPQSAHGKKNNNHRYPLVVFRILAKIKRTKCYLTLTPGYVD